ncbi:S41 family peptidase [Luteibacter aegosomatissinici]|uniref:S41 family peptidase n=1 Tax=Luteibacter aegosomatissinici TaxID=2911539 RepID=UPI001FF8F118|nr:S41 family peptidase [Luteibacter aegosomatissinici]UPG95391.1 S41 family peptidase [Luteibacter aegosomatissinici]
MGKTRWLLTSLSWLLVGLVPAIAAASSKDLQWVSVNENPAFKVSAKGDPWSDKGATIIVTRVEGATDKNGGAITGINLDRVLGKTVTLTGELSTTGTASNASMWLRTDGSGPGARAFQSTEPFPVHSGESPVPRSIRISVPIEAVGLRLGVALMGGGAVRVDHFHLAVADTPAASVDAPALLDEAVALIRDKALAAGTVDWNAFLADAHASLRSGEAANLAYPFIRTALGKLNDGHSHFINADAEWAASVTDGTKAPFDVRVLPGGMGYVALPGFSGPKDAQLHYVDSVATAMAHIAPEVTHGWVVDLRNNSGGNMWPMLGAVHSLLGDDSLGAFRRPGTPDAPWHAGRGLPEGVKPPIDLANARVAVLLGPHTASAGEAVAIAFHGRPATRSFGLPTSGHANANSIFRLKDGSVIALVTATELDRNGQEFSKEVQPDERVEGDAALDHATAWLTQQPPL